MAMDGNVAGVPSMLARSGNSRQVPTVNDRTRVAARAASAVLASVVLALPPVARGAFVCKPPGGSTIIRTTCRASVQSVEIREMNPDGSLKRIIPPPRTTEQRKAEEEEQQTET